MHTSTNDFPDRYTTTFAPVSPGVGEITTASPHPEIPARGSGSIGGRNANLNETTSVKPVTERVGEWFIVAYASGDGFTAQVFHEWKCVVPRHVCGSTLEAALQAGRDVVAGMGK